MKILGITAPPASALIKKMLDMELIYPMKGKGRCFLRVAQTMEN